VAGNLEETVAEFLANRAVDLQTQPGEQIQLEVAAGSRAVEVRYRSRVEQSLVAEEDHRILPEMEVGALVDPDEVQIMAVREAQV
jgi:hypothetical protein